MTVAFEKKIDYYDCDRAEMLQFLPSSCRRVLDVGCGTGAFGSVVKRDLGAEVWGIEPQEGPAATAIGRLDRVVISEFPLPDGRIPSHFFDCITFNDVLEHMVDPWMALREAKRLLAPGGCVVSSLPNIRYFPILYRLAVRGEWTYTESGVLDRTHLRFFTRTSIVDLFESSGFTVESISGLFPFRRWQFRALRLLLPGFVRDSEFINYAVRAVPRE